MDKNLREVIETKEFSEQLKSFGNPGIKRLDDVLFGVNWALSKNAETFPKVMNDPDISIIKTQSAKDLPSFRIYFKFDDNAVHLLWIEAIEREQTSEGN